MIERYEVSDSDSDSADPDSGLIILEVGQPYSNHNGGQIGFGPDGYLYIALGDGGGGGGPQGNGQNLETLLGSILRIDVDIPSGSLNYSIPSDNPFVSDPNAADEIYAYGLRNPWRFSFDEETDYLWAADVGQHAWEEIDIINSGFNYGWNIMEGNHCYPASVTNCDNTVLESPVFEYALHENGECAVTGGFVYRGTAMPSLIGKYIYGDYCSGEIWALDVDASFHNESLVNTPNYITSFGVDQENNLYYANRYGGQIYKLTSDEEPVCEANGDVNADEQVDVLDVIATVNHILSSSLLDECQFSAADVNGSGAIDVIDVVALVNIILEEPNVRDKELNPVAQGAEIINASVSGYGETMISLGIPYSVELSEVSFEISTTFNQNEDHAPDFIADIFNALSIDINYLGHLGIKYDGNIEDCINDPDGVTDGEINNANNSNCPDLYGLNAPADVILEITVSDGADYDAVHIINLDVIQSVGVDIVVSDSTLINSLQIATVKFGSDLACEYAEGNSSTTSPGDHSVLNFSTAIVNWGNEDFYLGSTACVGQDGCPFYWDTCHLHPHMEGYANYLLYEYPSMDLVEIGNKIGWCVMDLSSVGGQTPPEYADYDTSPNPTYGCSTMGISSGYSDVYSSGLSDQWIDLDALQNAGTLGGEYVIAVCTNIQNADFEDFYVSGSDFEPQPEINYANNCASARITLDDNNGSVTVSNVAPFLGELIALDCEVTDVAGVEFGVVFHDVSIDQYDINNGDLRLPPVVYYTSDDAALFYRQDLTIFVGDDAVMITNVELPGGLALHHVDPSIAPWSSSSNDSNDFLLSETSCFTIEGIISAEISVDSPFEVIIEGTVNNDSSAVDLIASVDKVVISSTAIVYGCTDENDLSYNPDATIADGSCSGVLAITGCTASQALNHNPDATQDDGSCIFCGEGGVNVGASYPITVGMYDSDGGGWDGSLQLAYEDTDLLRTLERDNSCADFNEDGSVDVIDVVTLVNTILQTSTDGTDLNGDDSIDVIDVVLLVNYILDSNIVLQCPNEDLSLMFYIPSIDIAYCTEDIDFSVCELYDPAISDTAEFHVNVFEDYKLDIDLKAGYEQGEFKLCALEQNIVVTKSDNLADYYKLDGTISDAPEHFISSESSTFCNNVIGGTVPGAQCDPFFESNLCLDDSFQFDCKGACIETSLANVLDSDNTCQDGSDGGVDLSCDSFPLEQQDCGPYCGDGNCDVGEENNANCPSDCVNSCLSGYVLDCSDDDCCPENWIGDGFCDGPDQQWGCNLICHDNDEGDCDAFI